MKPEAKYRRVEQVAQREIAGETFLIPVCGTPVDVNNIFVLNPIADFIWQRLDGGKTLATIIAEIVEEFDVESGRAEDDAGEFVTRLLQNGLVEALP